MDIKTDVTSAEPSMLKLPVTSPVNVTVLAVVHFAAEPVGF
jgi:hypothetical protein